MNHHYFTFVGKIFEAVANRVASLASANGKEQSFGVALEKPWRRVTNVLMRQDNNYHGDVFALLEKLKTVQQHRLSSDPAELLDLIAARARSLAAGDDHYADITIH
jgi:hypothetical protein